MEDAAGIAGGMHVHELLRILAANGLLVALKMQWVPRRDLIHVIDEAPWMLALLCFLEIAKVAFSKRLSGHTTVFSLPHYINPVRGDLSKGPLLKRTVLR